MREERVSYIVLVNVLSGLREYKNTDLGLIPPVRERNMNSQLVCAAHTNLVRHSAVNTPNLVLYPASVPLNDNDSSRFVAASARDTCIITGHSLGS